MAYANDSLLQMFRDDNLVAMGYHTFQVAELLEHLRVLREAWISLASVASASLNERDELAELPVLLCCILDFS